MKWQLTVLTLALITISACKKKNARFSPIPAITLNGIRPDSLQAGSSKDTLFISFHFTDGDGDIGNDPNSTNYDYFLTDSRDTGTKFNYFFPNIPDMIKDPDLGVEGDCIFYIPAANILLRDTSRLRDTLHYDLYMKDVAGNKSNVISTGDIYLKK